MKKLFVSFAVLAVVFGSTGAQAQVSETFEWA